MSGIRIRYGVDALYMTTNRAVDKSLVDELVDQRLSEKTLSTVYHSRSLYQYSVDKKLSEKNFVYRLPLDCCRVVVVVVVDELVDQRLSEKTSSTVYHSRVLPRVF